MIQLFMSRSGSSVIVPLNLPASHGAIFVLLAPNYIWGIIGI